MAVGWLWNNAVRWSLRAGTRIRLQFGTVGFNPWVGKIPWRRGRQPTPVFLLGESQWTEEPGGLQSMESQRVRHDWMIKHTAGEASSTWLITGTQQMPSLSSCLSTLDIYVFGLFFLSRADFIISTQFYYIHKTVFSQYCSIKMVRTFWVTFIWGPLESLNGALPSGDS